MVKTTHHDPTHLLEVDQAGVVDVLHDLQLEQDEVMEVVTLLQVDVLDSDPLSGGPVVGERDEAHRALAQHLVLHTGGA